MGQFLPGLSLAVFSAAGAVQAAIPANLDETLQKWLEQRPGGIAIAYVNADGVTFYNAGKLDDAAGVSAITPDTQFEIGSITKVFTAVLLADAVQAGKVLLEAPVGPPFAPSRVTYLQLATHTAGLPLTYADKIGYDLPNPYAGETLTSLLELFASVAPTAKPGPGLFNSNLSFAVLGQALASAWGKSYADLLKERVLRPLELNDTVISWREAGAARLAPGHNKAGMIVHWDLNAYAPALAMVSTSRDLAKFVQACLGLRTTPLQAVLAETLRPRVSGYVPTRQIGLAWQIERRDDSTLIWHNGATGGYRSFVALNPARKTGIVILANQSHSLESLGFNLLAGQMPPPNASTVPVEKRPE